MLRCGVTVLDGVNDARGARVLMGLCGPFVHQGRLIMTISGPPVCSCGALMCFFETLSRQPGIVLAPRLTLRNESW